VLEDVGNPLCVAHADFFVPDGLSGERGKPAPPVSRDAFAVGCRDTGDDEGLADVNPVSCRFVPFAERNGHKYGTNNNRVKYFGGKCLQVKKQYIWVWKLVSSYKANDTPGAGIG
jgi:hypothetical protein